MGNSKSRFEPDTSRGRGQPRLPFRVKICGVTNVDDAALVVDAGADAVGLNFFAGSRRCISECTARKIVEVLPSRVVRVGVFVNAPLTEIRTLASALGLSLLQLHGDESWEAVAEAADVTGLPVIRAVRLRGEPTKETLSQLQHARNRVTGLAGVLIDSYLPGRYGGTGNPLDWGCDGLQQLIDGSLPVILAGGLTPENVGNAIFLLRPAAVDTASGVEIGAGQKKDLAKVRKFVTEAHAAFDRAAGNCDS